MEADFSGWATKASVKCSDGRTIDPKAFKHQDADKVPLVWQHDHKDPENVLGHVLLHHREEGIYCEAFFNDSKRAQAAKEAVIHKDIVALSIWANDLIEKAKTVLHGKIREVSLVLAGANPEALIDSVIVRHGDDVFESEDQAIIYTGLTFDKVAGVDSTPPEPVKHSVEEPKKEEPKKEEPKAPAEPPSLKGLPEEKKELFHKMLTDVFGHAEGDDEKTFASIYESMDEDQKNLLHMLLADAVGDDDEEEPKKEEPVVKQDTINTPSPIIEGTATPEPKGTPNMGNTGTIRHNVFEMKGEDGGTVSRTLTHDDMKAIHKAGEKLGSLKEAVEEWAEANLAHGIQDIEILFPDATTIGSTPEMFARRAEWVGDLMGKVTKRPFARIRTFSADLTLPEARAKGYVKGTLKKEEFFRVTRRTTTPTTIYKKQKLDRDDIIDITDFDVVAWLKAEMRFMLDEEIARAVLVGDGRAADDEDKIDEECIRPIASDHELYVTTVNINIGDSNSSIDEAIEAIILNRRFLRGTGRPTFYTTEEYIARFQLLKDNTGRRVYRNLDELVTELRVNSIVAVEVLEEYPEILGIMVNPVDYVVGADRGGQVAMFDDFDIDYNQYKYLIETRMSGALVKLKSALVLRSVAADSVLVVPEVPEFDGTDITIPTVAGVVYHRADTDAVVADGSTITLTDGQSLNIYAEPAAGKHFSGSVADGPWTFTGEA
jgi:hypothetical protein